MNFGRIALLTLALSACSGRPYVVEPEQSGEAVHSNRLYIATHGWHAGLVVPAHHLNAAVPELAARFGAVEYYELGWGDKGFYQAQEVTTALTFQAMFWSQGAVLHVVAVPDDPKQYFSGSEVLETCISDAEMASLKAFLANSFARGPAGQIVVLTQGIYGNSQFYDGEGRYYMLNTCNKWTAKALRSAGMDIDPTFKLIVGSIVRYLRSNQRHCGSMARDAQQSVPGDIPASGGRP